MATPATSAGSLEPGRARAMVPILTECHLAQWRSLSRKPSPSNTLSFQTASS
jgi:hypothetical protein